MELNEKQLNRHEDRRVGSQLSEGFRTSQGDRLGCLSPPIQQESPGACILNKLYAGGEWPAL